MFPIIRGLGARVITKGYYFGVARLTFSGSFPMFVSGYRSYARIIHVPTDKLIFRNDSAIDLHFMVPQYDLRQTSGVTVYFRAPSGRIVVGEGGFTGPNEAVYAVKSGDLTEVGMYKYQFVLTFPGKRYHLDVGKFRVKPNIALE